MFSKRRNNPDIQVGADWIIDRIAENSERLNKAKPFFPTLTKFFLILGLGFLSWLATYTGMLELIIANSGDLGFSFRIAIAFAVAMLMLMIIYLLDSLFSPLRWWLRLLYISGYLFLTLISVGFGFGFYWKFLESRAEATRSAESAVGQVQTALQGGQTRLEQLITTLTTLTALSAEKAEIERLKGGTCPNSPPGDGPRRRLRDADAKNFQFAGDFVATRVGSVENDINVLNTDMAKIVTRDKTTVDPTSGTRNTYLRGINRKLDLTIARFNAFRTDPQLKQFRDDFATRASKTVFDNGRGGTFTCPDQQLQVALRGVVKAIDGLPDLTKPAIAAVEGSEAIVEAFRRLTTTTIGLLTFNMPPSPDELRALQQKAVQSLNNNASSSSISNTEAGLGERDYIPLFIAIFVDFCILLVSINRPVNRLQGLVAAAREASGAQVHRVLDQFHKVHKGERSERLDIFHDLMFDNSWGDQLVAVPLDVKPDSSGQDLKKKVIKARYLSTLLVALEDTGLVSRKPLVRTSWIKKKLEEIGSPYSNSESFRIYRFARGAWSAIILDDIIGESGKFELRESGDAQQHAFDQLFRKFDPEDMRPSQADLGPETGTGSFEPGTESRVTTGQPSPRDTETTARQDKFGFTDIVNDNLEPKFSNDKTAAFGHEETGTNRNEVSASQKEPSEFLSEAMNGSASDISWKSLVLSDSDNDQMSQPDSSGNQEDAEGRAKRRGNRNQNKEHSPKLRNSDSAETPLSDRSAITLQVIAVKPEAGQITKQVNLDGDQDFAPPLNSDFSDGDFEYFLESSLNESGLNGNPWIGHRSGEAPPDEPQPDQDELVNQIVPFPKTTSEPPPITDQTLLGENRQHQVQPNVQQHRNHHPELELENKIWRDGRNDSRDDNRDFGLTDAEENDDYNWDQPDIQSEKIARRFAAKNDEKIAES